MADKHKIHHTIQWVMALLWSVGVCAASGCGHRTAGKMHDDGSSASGWATASEVAMLRQRMRILEKQQTDLDVLWRAFLQKRGILSRVTGSTAEGFAAEAAAESAPPARAVVREEPAVAERVSVNQVSAERVSAHEQAPSVELPRPAAYPTPVPLPANTPMDTPISIPAPKKTAADFPKLKTMEVQGLYDWSRERFVAREYATAMQGFQDLSRRFSGHRLASNALYWIGMCHFEQRMWSEAIAVWQQLADRYPVSNKLADALFGQAQAYERLGEGKTAAALYGRLLADHPQAERASEARQALLLLKKQSE